jgi:hypothetical protein
MRKLYFSLSILLVWLLTACPGPTPRAKMISAKNDNLVLEIIRDEPGFSKHSDPKIESIFFYRDPTSSDKKAELLWSLESEHGAISVPNARIKYGVPIQGFKSSQPKPIKPRDKLFVTISGMEYGTPAGINLEYEVLGDGTIVVR